jgi:hypothetical protein
VTLERVLAVGAALVIASALTQARQSVAKMNDSIRITATIEPIDATKRRIMFRSEDGMEGTVVVGFDVKRFDELKVGDKVWKHPRNTR